MRYLIYISLFSILTYYFMDDLFLDGTNRPNITFIVGEDAEQENQYYAAAAKYYRTHDIGNQSFVVDTCRSLVAIQQFLKTHPTHNDKPWGRINIVAHGNEWTGLKLAIEPTGKGRVNTATLENALDKDLMPSLKRSRKIDRLTQLHIQGCGVGKDVVLLKTLKRAFGGRLQVYSPEKFVLYQSDNQCYMADNYYSFHHPDSVCSVAKSVRDLEKRYPSVSLDWEDILDTESPQNPQSPFVYFFKIPVRWTVNFKDTTKIPQFPNAKGLQFEDWLGQQKDLMASLEKIHLPKKAFRWVYEMEGNSMKIYGVCQVVCILKPEEKAVSPMVSGCSIY